MDDNVLSVKKDMAVPSPGDDDHRNSAKKDLDMTSQDSGPGMLRPFIFQLTLFLFSILRPILRYQFNNNSEKKNLEENGDS